MGLFTSEAAATRLLPSKERHGFILIVTWCTGKPKRGSFQFQITMDTAPKHAVYSQAPIGDLLRSIYMTKYVMFEYFFNQFLKTILKDSFRKAVVINRNHKPELLLVNATIFSFSQHNCATNKMVT